MRDFVLNESNYGKIKDESFDLAILPWGATEPHNYHLPYGTDTLETTYIAETAAAKASSNGARVMVLPTIHLGMQNPGQIEIPFCLSASLNTQVSILKDIVASLSVQGLKKLIILNGHGGNDFKPVIRDLYSELDDFFIGLTSWYELLDNSKYFDIPGDHAGEMETSIMMYAFPDIVQEVSASGMGEANNFKAECMKNKEVWTPRNWSKVSLDTGIGNPKFASVEKGKIFLDDLTNRLSEIFIELCELDVNNMYNSD